MYLKHVLMPVKWKITLDTDFSITIVFIHKYFHVHILQKLTQFFHERTKRKFKLQ